MDYQAAGYDYIEDASDNDLDSDNSDDEIDAILRQKFCNEKIEDDFDTEMNKELDSHMRNLEYVSILKRQPPKLPEQSTQNSNRPDSSQRCYDNMYSSSSSDDEEEENEKGTEKDVSEADKANDDLFYDPMRDDKDQKWMDNKRKKQQGQGSGTKALPNSDAVLNCPACMALLCLDCQRHEIYNTQYRAMFVMNCNVDTENYLETKNRGRGKKLKNRDGLVTEVDEEKFHPVCCSTCSTEVAAFDKEEVYHFYNIIASHT